MLADLNRRRILRGEDTIICDKGYYAYDNYALAAREFRVIPVISPEKGFDPQEDAPADALFAQDHLAS